MQRRTIAGSTIVALGLSIGTALAGAQATDGDKSFLTDTAQDSAFEIKSGELALKKSSSADVKAYAQMVINDHHQLQRQVEDADRAV